MCTDVRHGTTQTTEIQIHYDINSLNHSRLDLHVYANKDYYFLHPPDTR